MIRLKLAPIYILLLFSIISCTEHDIREDSKNEQLESVSQLHLIKPEYREFLKEHKYIHTLLDSFEYYSKHNKPNATALTRIKIADYLRSTGNYEDGIQFLQSVLRQNLSLDKGIKANTFYGLSAIYYELSFHRNKDTQYLDSARYYALKAIDINKNEDYALTSNLLNIIGGIYLQHNNSTEAIIYLDSALKIRTERHLDADPALLNNLAFAYNLSGNHELALNYAQQCHLFALKSGDEVFASIALQTMADIYLAKGDSLMAVEIKKEVTTLKSSKNSILKTLIAKELILNYHHNKDSEIISDLNEDQYYLIGISRLLAITALLLIIGLILILYFLRQSQKLRQSEKELQQSHIESNQLILQNTELELKAKEAESQLLKSDLEKKEANLAAKLTALSQSNEFLLSIRKELVSLSKSKDTESALVKLTQIEEKIAQQLNGNIWEEFELLYSSGNSSFIKNLSEQYPDLTTNDKRLCYLILMNLSTKEISGVLSKTSRSVEVARHRLRNKLSLKRSDKLHTFLLDFSKNL